MKHSLDSLDLTRSGLPRYARSNGKTQRLRESTVLKNPRSTKIFVDSFLMEAVKLSGLSI